MIQEFERITQGISERVSEWENKLVNLDATLITEKRNKQNRTIKQIIGHMVDSATNNLHRIIYLQYGENPLAYPNYATYGNNDRWIAIQNYQEEDWQLLVQLWKYTNLHVAHIIKYINPEKLNNKWIADAATGSEVSLRDMVIDYLSHLELHLNEIKELIEN